MFADPLVLRLFHFSALLNQAILIIILIAIILFFFSLFIFIPRTTYLILEKVMLQPFNIWFVFGFPIEGVSFLKESFGPCRAKGFVGDRLAYGFQFTRNIPEIADLRRVFPRLAA
jgi:hypothetical protein